MNLFTDLFDSIEKAIRSIKAIANLPKQTRDELRATFEDTFKLLDTSLNMVIIRLGEILRIKDEPTFSMEVSLLNVDANWAQAEREFRLCRSLRHAVNEAGRLKTKLMNSISVQDWDDMLGKMEAILMGEDRLGDFIAERFQVLSASTGGTTMQTRQELKQFVDNLNIERRRLIAMETDLYNNF
jgi:hypothetical protein